MGARGIIHFSIQVIQINKANPSTRSSMITNDELHNLLKVENKETVHSKLNVPIFQR